MKLTTKGRYGLRVMLELAMNRESRPMAVDVISKNQDISPNYIHVLVTALRNAGMVRTVRGPNGGYALGQDPKNITILKIIEVLEGKQSWVECLDDACACPRAPSCAARELWREVIDSVEGLLSSRTLADLAEQQRAKQEAHLMYYI